MSEKQLNTRIQNKYDFEKNWDNDSDFTPLKGEMIVYAAEIDEDGNTIEGVLEGLERTTPFTYARIKIGDGVKKPKDLPFVNSEDNKQETISVAYPSLKQQLVYNGKEQTPDWEYDTDKIEIVSNPSGKIPGTTYFSTFQLKEGYYWPDMTEGQKNIEWTINKFKPQLTVILKDTDLDFTDSMVTCAEALTNLWFSEEELDTDEYKNALYSATFSHSSSNENVAKGYKPDTGGTGRGWRLFAIGGTETGDATITYTLQETEYYESASVSINVTNDAFDPTTSWENLAEYLTDHDPSAIFPIGFQMPLNIGETAEIYGIYVHSGSVTSSNAYYMIFQLDSTREFNYIPNVWAPNDYSSEPTNSDHLINAYSNILKKDFLNFLKDQSQGIEVCSYTTHNIEVDSEDPDNGDYESSNTSSNSTDAKTTTNEILTLPSILNILGINWKNVDSNEVPEKYEPELADGTTEDDQQFIYYSLGNSFIDGPQGTRSFVLFTDNTETHDEVVGWTKNEYAVVNRNTDGEYQLSISNTAQCAPIFIIIGKTNKEE